MTVKLRILLLLPALCLALRAFPQTAFHAEDENAVTRILIIFDASNSMAGTWEHSQKFQKARQLLFELLDSLETLQHQQHIELALRLYGHQYHFEPQNCTDSKLEVAFGENTINMIRDRMSIVVPKGTTPLAYSIGKAENDFPPCSCDDCRNIIVLITDGIEMCEGNPCDVSLALQKKGVILKPYIIGVDVADEQTDLLDCIGNYFNASNEHEFRKAINTIVGQVTNLTSVQVNLLDADGRPTETNAVMSFHDKTSGEIRYTYLHTMNAAGQPDTLYLDLLSEYNLVVHTVDAQYKYDIRLTEGEHNVIELQMPQGYLFVNIQGEDSAARNREVKCLIKRSGLPETRYVADADKRQKLSVGLYDLEILTMPTTYFSAVAIAQGRTTTVDIPEPGDVVVNFKNPAYGTLLHEYGNILTNIYDFTPTDTHYKMRLQPGYYRIVFREERHKTTAMSHERKFRVRPGDFIIENL